MTRAIDVKTEKVAGIEGLVVSTGRYAGTAVFADGSSLVMRYEGTLVPGKPMRGSDTVLSGSGIYKGATGTGHFEKAVAPWENANLYTGVLQLSTP